MSYAERIRIKGIVQGVGFRPTVWCLANELNLTGHVLNDGLGVLIELQGNKVLIEQFLTNLNRNLPPLARIDTIEREVLEYFKVSSTFTIAKSTSNNIQTHISLDAATCSQCLAEVLDPTNRRYQYPFTNCTHCGPRLSIVKGIPYDRANTTMTDFVMCAECQSEYENPNDRRFHAQPNACPHCGPQVWLEAKGEVLYSHNEAIAQCAEYLKQGKIVAIKGIGGIHLACDPTNGEAVKSLRTRKHRPYKPLALMAKSIEQIREYCLVNEAEYLALKSTAAPIVLLDVKTRGFLSPLLAPNQNQLGFMLPYSPLHTLLMQYLTFPIVLTSGNRSGEPQCITNEQSRTQLADIADAQLLHNREIANRLDDSVMRFMAGKMRILRRARGFAPAPISLPQGFEKANHIVALGGELKSTACLVQDGQAVLTQHLGDLDNYATLQEFERQVGLYQTLYQHQPQVLALDKHPNYHSTQWGLQLAQNQSIPAIQVQHHHAHLASCLVDNGYPLEGGKVLGIILDGTGLGEDGTLWGGEILLGDYQSFERLAWIKPVPLLGGTQAILQPWRLAYVHLKYSDVWEQVVQEFADLPIIQYLQTKPLKTLDQMVAKGINSPSTSSCGRLFDAVAALLGICTERISYEGQAAVELEALAQKSVPPLPPSLTLPPKMGGGEKSWMYTNSCSLPPLSGEGLGKGGNSSYSLTWQNNQLLTKNLWLPLLTDLVNQVDHSTIAQKFQSALAQAFITKATTLTHEYAVSTIVLSGGVMQNRFMLETLTSALEQQFTVFNQCQVPANDGGLALGQAAIAAARTLRR